MIRRLTAPNRYAFDYLERLYQFKSFLPDLDFDRAKKGYLASTILDGIVYLPTASQFNDPWEASPKFSLVPGARQPEHDVSSFLNGLLSQADDFCDDLTGDAQIRALGTDAVLDKMHQVISAQLAETPILCLTESPENQLLWSYYANGHSGYSLVFDAKSLPFAAAVRVRYSRAYPAIRIKRQRRIGVASIALAQKALHWRHEKEWRLILSKNPGPEFELDGLAKAENLVPGIYLRIPLESLLAVIVGFRVKPANLRELSKVVSERSIKIPVIQARQVPDKFMLEITE